MTYVRTTSIQEIQDILIQGFKEREAMPERPMGSLGQGITTGYITTQNTYGNTRHIDRYFREVRANLLYSDTLLSRF